MSTCSCSSPSLFGIIFCLPAVTGFNSQSPSVSLSGVINLCMQLCSVLLMNIAMWVSAYVIIASISISSLYSLNRNVIIISIITVMIVVILSFLYVFSCSVFLYVFQKFLMFLIARLALYNSPHAPPMNTKLMR